MTGKNFTNAICDRGYRDKKKIGHTNVIIPGNSAGKSEYEKRKRRAKCLSRAAIEPIIGHVKHDCRMVRNYLKGQIGDKINALMAAAGFNFRRLLRKPKAEVIFFLFQLQKIHHLKPTVASQLILMTYISSPEVSC